MAVEIPLSRGKVAIVDDEDAPRIRRFGWYVHSTRNPRRWYALRRGASGPDHIQMHRMILAKKMGRPLKAHECTDHINDDGLDNRRANLRVCTASQNAANALRWRIRGGKTSRFRGVCWHKCDRRWRVSIQVAKKYYYLGNYESEEEAARAYDRAAQKHFGEFARLNFPTETENPCRPNATTK